MLDDEDGGLLTFAILVIKGSEIFESDSGNISQIVSSVRTTSAIEGRASVSSWQHLRANVTNLSTHSAGYDPSRQSIIEKTFPD